MMEQEATVVSKQEERKHNLQSLHRISVAGFVVRIGRHLPICRFVLMSGSATQRMCRWNAAVQEIGPAPCIMP